MNFSIIIPTYNRLPYLQKCLESLLNLDYENYEIIVVDDCSSDGTKEFLEKIKNDKIKITRNARNLGPSGSRNKGVEMAEYDFLAFTDDDCAADKKWLCHLAREFEDHTYHAEAAQASAVSKNEKGMFIFGRVVYIHENYKGYFPERLVNIKNWPAGANITFRKDVFQKLGGFNSEYDKYHNEDTELALRAAADGYNYRYVKDALVYHQKSLWTRKSLLASAMNASVWPKLKKRYPNHFFIFYPPIRLQKIVNATDYLYFFALPVLIPILFIRYLYHGKRDFKIFFAKWPVYLILRRFYIYREAMRNRIFMV